MPDSGADFVFRVRVYWEDTDAGGIVFYGNYVKFFERARTEWLRSLGFSQEGMRQAAGGGMFVVSDMSIRYLGPARLDDELEITARLMDKGRASLIFFQQARRQGQVLCEGEIRAGWVAPSKPESPLRPQRIPQNIWNAIPDPVGDADPAPAYDAEPDTTDED